MYLSRESKIHRERWSKTQKTALDDRVERRVSWQGINKLLHISSPLEKMFCLYWYTQIFQNVLIFSLCVFLENKIKIFKKKKIFAKKFPSSTAKCMWVCNYLYYALNIILRHHRINCTSNFFSSTRFFHVFEH